MDFFGIHRPARGAARVLLLAGMLLPFGAGAADPKEIATSICFVCHGEGGNSVVPNFPKLAGQHANYLEKQLNEFLSGKRKNEAMAPFLDKFGKGDVAGLAAYYAGQKQTPGVVADAKLAEAGKKVYEDGNTETGVPACMGCHMPKGEGNERYPRLAGQHQAYTQQQMADFKKGVRTNDKAKVMRAVAERMSEEEMLAVSEFIAGLQ
jgi:cytochrome c553